MTPRRGAPPGNKNALKHGFYSRDFPRTDLQNLAAVDSKGLSDEITLVRLHLLKLTGYALAAPTLAEYLEILRVSNLYATSLNRLVKTQMQLVKEGHCNNDNEDAQLRKMLEEVLGEVQATWTLDGDPPPEDPH